MIRLLFSGNCCTLCAWQVFVPVRVYGITSCQSLCPFPMIPCEAHSSNPQYHVILLLHCHVSSSTHHFKTIQCYQISLVSFTGPYWNQPAPFLSWQNRNQRWNSTENHIGPNSCITCHCLNNMAIISLNKTVIIYKLLINTNLLTHKKKKKESFILYDLLLMSTFQYICFLTSGFYSPSTPRLAWETSFYLNSKFIFNPHDPQVLPSQFLLKIDTNCSMWKMKLKKMSHI